MLAKSCAAISSAASAVIGFTAVPAAITLVDVRIGAKFTTLRSILAPKRHNARPRNESNLPANPVLSPLSHCFHCTAMPQAQQSTPSNGAPRFRDDIICCGDGGFALPDASAAVSVGGWHTKVSEPLVTFDVSTRIGTQIAAEIPGVRASSSG
jgi:hypothetical protein